MDEFVFTKGINNGIFPDKQLACSYFIADFRFEYGQYEVRPITFGHILYALARNYGRLVYWGFCRVLFKSGFICKPDNERFYWKHHFRWCFWQQLTYKEDNHGM